MAGPLPAWETDRAATLLSGAVFAKWPAPPKPTDSAYKALPGPQVAVMRASFVLALLLMTNRPAFPVPEFVMLSRSLELTVIGENGNLRLAAVAA